MRDNTYDNDLDEVDEPTEADLALTPAVSLIDLYEGDDDFPGSFVGNLPRTRFPLLYPKDSGMTFTYMMGEDDPEGDALVAVECEVLS